MFGARLESKRHNQQRYNNLLTAVSKVTFGATSCHGLADIGHSLSAPIYMHPYVVSVRQTSLVTSALDCISTSLAFNATSAAWQSYEVLPTHSGGGSSKAATSVHSLRREREHARKHKMSAGYVHGRHTTHHGPKF